MGLRRVEVRTSNRNIYDRCRRLLREIDTEGVYLRHHHSFDFDTHVFDIILDSSEQAFESFFSGVINNTNVFISRNETVKNKNDHAQIKINHDTNIHKNQETLQKTQDGLHGETVGNLRERIRAIPIYDTDVNIDEMNFNELNVIYNSLYSRINIIYHYIHLEGMENTQENIDKVNAMDITEVYERTRRE